MDGPPQTPCANELPQYLQTVASVDWLGSLASGHTKTILAFWSSFLHPEPTNRLGSKRPVAPYQGNLELRFCTKHLDIFPKGLAKSLLPEMMGSWAVVLGIFQQCLLVFFSWGFWKPGQTSPRPNGCTEMTARSHAGLLRNGAPRLGGPAARSNGRFLAQAPEEERDTLRASDAMSTTVVPREVPAANVCGYR